MDLFHSLDNLKSQLASIACSRNTGVYNVQAGAVIESPVVVLIPTGTDIIRQQRTSSAKDGFQPTAKKEKISCVP